MLLPKLTKNGHVTLETPNFNPDFVRRAKKLGGVYKHSAWTFDARDFDRVKDAATAVWGALEGDGTPLVDVELAVEGVSLSELYFAGRQVLSRRGRDEEVKLGPSVVITSGAFRSSGGSRMNPMIGAPVGCKPVFLEVRDVPRPLAEWLAKDDAKGTVRLLPPRSNDERSGQELKGIELELRTEQAAASRRYVVEVVAEPLHEGWRAQANGGIWSLGVTELEAIEHAFQSWATTQFLVRKALAAEEARREIGTEKTS